MKAATPSKTKLYTAIALCVVAALAIAWAVLPSFSSGTASTPHASSPGAKTKAVPPDSLDPRLRLDLLASSEEVKYEGKGKNIFRATSEPVTIDKVKVPPLYRDQRQALAQGPRGPMAPSFAPINLKYFGSSASKGEKPKAFLSQGDDVWIAHEGDVVNRHYRIIRISPREVEIEDLLNNHRENIPLTQG
jgi:hypothetical protein